MLKFGTPTIALPLAIKKCTVQTGCTVHVLNKYNYLNIIGKDSALDQTVGCGVTQAVVLSLVQTFHHKGHHLYIDNLYTSPTLFAILSASGIGTCGTLRTNRKGVPHSIKTSKLSKGDVVTATTEGDMLFLKWKDKREVSLLTTIHDDSSVLKERHSRLVFGGTEEISKPYAIDQYN